ncbi:MAG: sulfatase [bacterium]|nr:sulfatase [bacterium]
MSRVKRNVLFGLLALGIVFGLYQIKTSVKKMLTRIPIVDEIAYAAREVGFEILREKPICGPPPSGDPPNVIVVAIDSLRADRIAPYGAAATPHLERLAGDSIVFDWAFSSAPWTIPGFAGVFTGEHPRALGMAGDPIPVPPEAATIGSLLCEAGYRTEGVVSHTYVGRYYGFEKGFDRWDQSLARGHTYVSSRAVTDRAIARVSKMQSGDRPFLLFVHYFDPHYSYVEHTGFELEGEYAGPLVDRGGPVNDIFELRRLSDERGLSDADYSHLEKLYDSEIEFMDRQIGRLLDTLRADDLYDDSVIVFVADHGEMLGRREPMRWIGHTKYVWNSVIRVPLFVKLPDQVRRERVAIPVSTVDVLPTVLDALGSDIVEGGPPRSRSLLRSRDDLARPVFAQTRRWLNFDSVIRDRYKLIAETDSGALSLFDYVSDPDERRDLSSEHPNVVAALATVLEDWVAEMERLAGGREPAVTVELSPEEREQLEKLGYID